MWKDYVYTTATDHVYLFFTVTWVHQWPIDCMKSTHFSVPFLQQDCKSSTNSRTVNWLNFATVTKIMDGNNWSEVLEQKRKFWLQFFTEVLSFIVPYGCHWDASEYRHKSVFSLTKVPHSLERWIKMGMKMECMTTSIFIIALNIDGTCPWTMFIAQLCSQLFPMPLSAGRMLSSQQPEHCNCCVNELFLQPW